MLPLEDFISKNKDWKQKLVKEKGLVISEKYPYVLITYRLHTPNLDFSDPVSKMCRGIIYNEKTNKIVCYPFDKFFNFGEPYAAALGGKQKVLEKVDGSLIKFWIDEDELHISTNGGIDAYQAPVGDISFGSLVEKALKAMNITDLDAIKEELVKSNSCAMFELVGPENQVVVGYSENELFYLGSRRLDTYKEFSSDFFKDLFPTPAEYDINFDSYQDLVDFGDHLISTNDEIMEGFVVVDENYHRVKVKTTEYFMQHYLRTNSLVTNTDRGRTRIIEAVLDGEIDELRSYKIPLVTDYAEKVYFSYLSIVNTIKRVNLNLPKKEYVEKVRELYRKELFPLLMCHYDNPGDVQFNSGKARKAMIALLKGVTTD